MNLTVRGECGRGVCVWGGAPAPLPKFPLPTAPLPPPSSPSQGNRDNRAGTPSPWASQALFSGESLTFRFPISTMFSGIQLPHPSLYFIFNPGQFWKDPTTSSSTLISPPFPSIISESRNPGEQKVSQGFSVFGDGEHTHPPTPPRQCF